MTVASPGDGKAARTMLRRALKGALATLNAGDALPGSVVPKPVPHASLVQVASMLDGRPTILVSQLALHTRNLTGCPLASLLIDESDARGDPAAGARVSYTGPFAVDTSAEARERYLARHPAAAQFADFADFRFMSMTVVSAHLVRGFGRIVGLAGSDVVLGDNLTRRYATDMAGALDRLRKMYPQITGLDPEGFDLMVDGCGRRVALDWIEMDAEAYEAKALELLDPAIVGGPSSR